MAAPAITNARDFVLQSAGSYENWLIAKEDDWKCKSSEQHPRPSALNAFWMLMVSTTGAFAALFACNVGDAVRQQELTELYGHLHQSFVAPVWPAALRTHEMFRISERKLNAMIQAIAPGMASSKNIMVDAYTLTTAANGNIAATAAARTDAAESLSFVSGKKDLTIYLRSDPHKIAHR
jgi:glycogen debranching enzyme